MSRRKSTLTGIRAWWYLQHRMMRIVTRETLKAYTDTMLYGTGYVLITNEPDYIRHVPLQDITFRGPQ